MTAFTRLRVGRLRMRAQAECAACGPLPLEGWLPPGPPGCPRCRAPAAATLRAWDPGSEEELRYPYLDRDALFQHLARIAEARRGRVGFHYLSREDPGLLLHCVWHHGSYERARGALSAWMSARAAAAEHRLEERIRVRSGGEAEHCVYCRDTFAPDEVRHRCACGAVLHHPCRAENRRCTTLGCDAPYSPESAPTAAAEPTPEPTPEPALEPRVLRPPRAPAWAGPERRSFSYGLPGVVQGLAWGLLVVLPIFAAEQLAPAAPPLLVLLGLGLALGRRGVTLDRRERTQRSWLGLHVPLWEDLPLFGGWRPLGNVSEVRLAAEEWWHGGEGHGSTVYAVRLGRLVLTGRRDYLPARNQAELAAHFLGLGVHDAVSGSRRAAGTLDQPLVERETAGVPEHPEPPPRGLAGRLRVEGRVGRFALPPRSLAFVAQAAFVAGELLLAWLCLRVGALGGPLLVLLAIVHLLIVSAREQVEASPEGLSVRRRSWLSWWRGGIPCQELEELDRAEALTFAWQRLGLGLEGRVLCARSDRRLLEFGGGLDPRELRWLRDAIVICLLGHAADLAAAAELRSRPPERGGGLAAFLMLLIVLGAGAGVDGWLRLVGKRDAGAQPRRAAPVRPARPSPSPPASPALPDPLRVAARQPRALAGASLKALPGSVFRSCGVLRDPVQAVQSDGDGRVWLAGARALFSAEAGDPTRLRDERVGPLLYELRREPFVAPIRGLAFRGERPVLALGSSLWEREGPTWRALELGALPMRGLEQLIGLDGELFALRNRRLERWSETGWVVERTCQRDTVLGVSSTRRLLLADPSGVVEREWAGAWRVRASLGDNAEGTRLRALAEDAAGLWVGTDAGLLWVQPTGQVRRLFPGAQVRQLVPAGGRLWVGSRDAGLLLRAQGAWFRYGPEDGLPHPELTQLAVGRGHLWCVPWGAGLLVASLAEAEAALREHPLQELPEVELRAQLCFLGKPIAADENPVCVLRCGSRRIPAQQVDWRDGRLVVRGLRPGPHSLNVRVGRWPDALHHPGLTLRLPQEGELRVPLRRAIRLLEPFDGHEPLEPGPRRHRLPLWPTPLRLAWEPLGEGVRYRYRVTRVPFDAQGSPGHHAEELLAGGTRTDCQLLLELPPSSPGEAYVFQLEAEHAGIPAGTLRVRTISHRTVSDGPELRFRLRRP